MVRAAVRTLTLSVYRVREPSLERFILERTAKIRTGTIKSTSKNKMFKFPKKFQPFRQFLENISVFWSVLFTLVPRVKPYFSQLIFDCQQIAISVDTQHETGAVEKELLNEHLDFLHYFADIIVNSPHHLSTLLIELLLQKLFSVYASPIFKDIAGETKFTILSKIMFDLLFS